MLEETLKRKKTIKYILLCGLISILISVLTQRITLVLTVENVSPENGSVQLYYQNRPEAPMTEKNSLVCEGKKGDIEFDIKRTVLIGNQIRIDLNEISEIEISRVCIKWHGIPICMADEKTLLENKIKVQDLTDNDLCLMSTGEDPYIVFLLSAFKIFWLVSILFVVKLVLVYCATVLIGKIIYIQYKKSGSVFMKRVRIGIALFLILSIGYYAFHAVGAIKNINVQAYYVFDKNAEYFELSGDEVKTDFVNCSERLLMLGIDIEAIDGIKGSLLYRVENSKGEVVINEQQKNINEIINEEGNQLILDVSSEELYQNEQYVLYVRLVGAEDAGVKACMSNGQFVLRQYFRFLHENLYLAITGVCVLIGLVLVLCFIKWGMNNWVYVAISLLIGVLAIIVIPPASRDDEYRHFIRAYTLANGDYSIPLTDLTGDEIGNTAYEVPGKGYFTEVPKEISDLRLLDYSSNYNDGSYFAEVNQKLCVERFLALLRSDIDTEPVEVSVLATATRGWIYYWPQAIAIFMGMLVGIRPALLFYVSRMGQLVACTLLGYISLRITDKCRDMIWLLSFIPNTVLLKISCNTDGLLIAEIILYVSILFYVKEKKVDLLSSKGIIVFPLISILAITITKMKPPFLILCIATLLMLNKENIKSVLLFVKCKRKIVLPVSCAVLVMMIAVATMNITIILKGIYTILPYEHICYILENPVHIFNLFANKWVQQLGELVSSVNGVFFVPYSLVIIISLLLCQKEMLRWKKCSFFIAFVLSMWGIILVGFTLTPPDAGYIWGITYRYVLPALPLVGIALPSGNKITQEYVRQVYPLFIIATLTISCLIWIAELWNM